MFSDLECDYINPIDLCNKLNQVRFFFFLSDSDREFDAFFEVCPPGEHCPCFFDNAFPDLWAMDCIPPQCTTTSIQCQQVRYLIGCSLLRPMI